MKKLLLSVIGMYIGILASFSQSAGADSVYKKRKLSFEEANIVASYYAQNGDHSSVTGGIGTEKLADQSSVSDIKYSLHDLRGRKKSITGEIGIDHYTSASSDQINPKTISSASHEDVRVYPSLIGSIENEKKGSAISAGASFSIETDYKSWGGNLSFSQKTKNKSGELTVKALVYLDEVTLIRPIELRAVLPDNTYEKHYGKRSRNSYSGEVGWSQIINKKLQVLFDAGLIYQNGYLGLPFHRVYFKDGSDHIEYLPSTRLKVPLGFRANYFAGDKFIIRTWFRNYHDDWGVNCNALQLETVYKITAFFSVTPFYRFYQQSAADQFAGYRQHTAADDFYTSNYDLSKFNSNFFGVGFRTAPPAGLLKHKHWNALEIRYGHYKRTDGLSSDIISMSLKFK